MNRLIIPFLAGLVLVILVSVSGCDSTFEPLKPSDDIVFSMFGTLDLHADTQWVRVMPVGKKLLPNDSTISRAEVTLTRLETGETVTMRDSLFAFRNNTFILNYWTDTPLHPEEDYLLVAESDDGRTSRAMVSIPPALPRPITNYSTEEEEGVVVIPSSDSVVVAETRFLVRPLTPFGPAPDEEFSFSHLDQLFKNNDGHYIFPVEVVSRIRDELKTNFLILEREVVIALGSDEWPDLSDLTEEEAAIPGTHSNVENGTGIVAGVASRKAPLKRCVNENDELIPCEEEN